MKLCYVTDRKALPGPPDEQIRSLLHKIEAAAHAGVDWVQIREKDLDARVLAALVKEAKTRAGTNCRILVNDRLDVALAVGADGVHLGEISLPVGEVRRFLEEWKGVEPVVVGVSAHSVPAAKMAEEQGADYVVFGPIFATPSKLQYGPPLGPEQLADACKSISIPVLAIGGVTLQNAQECVRAGAAGIAAIRLFQDKGAIGETVRTLRSS
jgi:thiamine-phosphate pyrophosphorylase